MAPKKIQRQAVQSFWERHPVAAASIPAAPGTAAYFQGFDRLREALEPAALAERVYGFASCAGLRILDVGAGNGFVMSRYARAGAHAFGVELTARGVDLCRRRFEIEAVRASVTQADAEHLPFASASFDAVTSMGVLHHVPHPERAIEEIHRVLKPGGRLTLMLYHRNSAMYRLRFPLLRLLTGKSLADQVNEVDGAGNPKGIVFSVAKPGPSFIGSHRSRCSLTSLSRG
jgi:2-polyprenyl-3-methyl-5-hydroxy-6-metoxy-1,4-benzoquinol methylase